MECAKCGISYADVDVCPACGSVHVVSPLMPPKKGTRVVCLSKRNHSESNGENMVLRGLLERWLRQSTKRMKRRDIYTDTIKVLAALQEAE